MHHNTCSFAKSIGSSLLMTKKSQTNRHTILRYIQVVACVSIVANCERLTFEIDQSQGLHLSEDN
jgi:hypothetical protein